jgi:hypothetical protein
MTAGTSPHRYNPGETVVNQGDDADFCFVIRSGRCEVLVAQTETPAAARVGSPPGSPARSGSKSPDSSARSGSPDGRGASTPTGTASPEARPDGPLSPLSPRRPSVPSGSPDARRPSVATPEPPPLLLEPDAPDSDSSSPERGRPSGLNRFRGAIKKTTLLSRAARASIHHS